MEILQKITLHLGQLCQGRLHAFMKVTTESETHSVMLTCYRFDGEELYIPKLWNITFASSEPE